MSRSGYCEYDGDEDQWAMIRWRGAVASAFRGKKGQSFLKEMLSAMEAMPEKKLYANILSCEKGDCAMGTVVRSRGLDVNNIDPEDYSSVAHVLGINKKLAQEIAYMNDENWYWTYEKHHNQTQFLFAV